MKDTNICCIRNENGKIVAWCAGFSDKEINALLAIHPHWHKNKKEA